ncbi:MAG TPA: universal stress protein [Gaiellales bacterium]
MSPLLRQHTRIPDAPPVSGSPRTRPVMLATLAVPFDPDCARVAIQAALEGGVKLIVVDAVEVPFWPQSIAMRYADLEEDVDRMAIRRLVEQTVALGLEVEHLRVRSPRPVEALLEVAGERDAALLVLGPDRSRLRPKFFRRVVKRIRKRASCLLWVVGEGP